MNIVSISVSPQDLKKMDRAMKASGCKSRSKMVSMAIDALVREIEPIESLSGPQSAVITLTSGEKSLHVHRISHEYPGLVKLNAHVDSAKGCAEILVVEGPANSIRELFTHLRSSKEVKSASIALA